MVSWLLLRGRCRSCGEPISARYPLTELGLGLLCAVTSSCSATTTPPSSRSGSSSARCWSTITLTDLELRIIPNKILLVGAVVGVAVVAATDPDDLPERAIAAAAARAASCSSSRSPTRGAWGWAT